MLVYYSKASIFAEAQAFAPNLCLFSASGLLSV